MQLKRLAFIALALVAARTEETQVILDPAILLEYSRLQTQVAIIKPMYEAAVAAQRKKYEAINEICQKKGQIFDDAQFICRSIPAEPKKQ